LALGAVVGELRLFGGMVALSFAPFAIPAAGALPWGLAALVWVSLCCGLGSVLLRAYFNTAQCCSRRRRAKLRFTLDFKQNPML
jgi:hypothetical protein